MGKVSSFALFALILAACENPWADEKLTEAERVRAGWYEPSSRALAPRFCYRTLARVECFGEPQPELAERQVGSFHELAD